MAKSEKKKYTKKNIANKIDKSKKNSGTAKKKAFRKSKKSKKEEGGGFFTNKKQEKIDNLMIENQKLVNEFRNYKKRNQIEKMRETKNSLMENNMEIRTLNYGEKRPYKNTNELIIDTKLSLFDIPEQAIKRSSKGNEMNVEPLPPLPKCWEQKFKNFERFYILKGTEITRDKDHRPPPDYPCPGDEKEASNNIPLTAKSKSSNKQAVKPLPSNLTLEERRKRFKKEQEKAAQRASLEQRIKDAKAEAEAAKAERFKLEKAAKEKAAKEKAEKEKAEQEKIDATWSDSDATWKESYRAGK